MVVMSPAYTVLSSSSESEDGPRAESVQDLAHGATLVLLHNIHAVDAFVWEDQAFVKGGRDGDHGQAVGQHFVGEHVDGFSDLALVVLIDALGKVPVMANFGTSAIKARRMAFTWEASVSLIRIRISWPCGQPSTISVFISIHLLASDRRPRRPPFSWCHRERWG